MKNSLYLNTRLSTPSVKSRYRPRSCAWGKLSSFPEVKDSGLVDGFIGKFLREEKMLYSGTDPESYITEYTFVYEDDLYQLVLMDNPLLQFGVIP